MSDPRWDVPGSWVWTTAGVIADIVGGGTPPTSDPTNFSQDGVPWLTPADLTGYKGAYIGRGRRDLSEKGLASSGATLMPAGTVLFSSRAPIGYCAIAESEVSTNQGFKSLVLHGSIQPEYVRYYLLSSTEYAESLASGTTFKELSGARTAQLAIPLAPLPEQHRIVAKLDSLLGRSNGARDELARIPLLIEHYKQGILKQAFNGELTADWREKAGKLESARELIARTPPPSQPRGGREATSSVIEGTAAISVNNPGTPLPQGWEWVPLRRIARQETGHTPSRSKPEWWRGEICWIGIRDASLHHGRIIYDTIQKTNELGLRNSSARLLPTGTVCLSRTASVGYVTIMGREMATSQDFATWTCTKAIKPKYLMYALMSEGDEIRRFGEGSTHTTIYFPEIRAFHIKLAPIKEQDEIIARIEQSYARIDRLAEEAARASSLIDHLDQGLLAKAFRGELVAQDPNDEPAEKLLERVQAERTASSKASGRRGRRRLRESTDTRMRRCKATSGKGWEHKCL